jgi:hypothetical protein
MGEETREEDTLLLCALTQGEQQLARTVTVVTVMLCYVLLQYVMLWRPFNTPASAVGVGGGGFHGIRSVGGGEQPLKQQSGAFRRWVHLVAL